MTFAKRAKISNNDDSDRLLLSHIQNYIGALLGKVPAVGRDDNPYNELHNTAQQLEMISYMQERLQVKMDEARHKLASNLQELRIGQLAQDHRTKRRATTIVQLCKQLQTILSSLSGLKDEAARLSLVDHPPAELFLTELHSLLGALMRKKIKSQEVSVEAPDWSISPKSIRVICLSIGTLRRQLYAFQSALHDTHLYYQTMFDRHLLLLQTARKNVTLMVSTSMVGWREVSKAFVVSLQRLSKLTQAPPAPLDTNRLDSALGLARGLSRKIALIRQEVCDLREHNHDLAKRLRDVGDRQKQMEASLCTSQEEGKLLRRRLDDSKLEQALKEASMKAEIAKLEEQISILQRQLSQHQDSPICKQIRPELIPEKLDPKMTVVAFSGIRDPQLKSALKQLGITVHEGAEFSDQITHVVCNEGSQTMKVFAASITGKWILRPSWVLESIEKGQLVPEKAHGVLYLERPFKGKSFYLTAAFASQNLKHQIDPSCCHILIGKLGKGRIVKSISEADFIIAADQESVEQPEGSYARTLVFADFLQMIPAYRWSCGGSTLC